MTQNTQNVNFSELLSQMETVQQAISELTTQLYAIPVDAFSPSQQLQLNLARWSLNAAFKHVGDAAVIGAADRLHTFVSNAKSLLECINEQIVDFDPDAVIDYFVSLKKDTMFTITPDMVLATHVAINFDYHSDNEGGSYIYRSIRSIDFEWDEELMHAMIDMWFDIEVDEDDDDENQEESRTLAKEAILRAISEFLSDALRDNYYSDEALDLDALTEGSLDPECISLFPAKTLSAIAD